MIVTQWQENIVQNLAAVAVLANGQPSQETPNNIRDQPIDGELYVLSGILMLIESVFLVFLSFQCEIRRDRPAELRR